MKTKTRTVTVVLLLGLPLGWAQAAPRLEVERAELGAARLSLPGEADEAASPSLAQAVDPRAGAPGLHPAQLSLPGEQIEEAMVPAAARSSVRRPPADARRPGPTQIARPGPVR